VREVSVLRRELAVEDELVENLSDMELYKDEGASNEGKIVGGSGGGRIEEDIEGVGRRKAVAELNDEDSGYDVCGEYPR